MKALSVTEVTRNLRAVLDRVEHREEEAAFGFLAARVTKAGGAADFRTNDLWLAAHALERAAPGAGRWGAVATSTSCLPAEGARALRG